MRRILLALAFVGLISPAIAQNYSATAGSGLTFGAKLVTAVLYPQTVMCDPTTPAQCVAVNASGQITLANTSFAVTNAGTFPVQLSGATNNINNIAGTITLPTGASTSALQATLTTWAGGILGAMANYGTSPGAVLVPGINAFVTNSNANGQATMANSSPVVIASNQSSFPVTVAAGTAAIGSVFGPTAVGSANANPPVIIGGTVTGAAGANVQGLSIVAPSTAPVTATNTAVVVDLRPDSPGIITLGPATVANSVPQTLSTQYPTNATTTTPTAVTASATGTTAATAATLAATASVTNFVCGFDVTADATALTTGTAVLSGTISGSLSYLQTIVAVTSGTSQLTRTFNPCIPASAANIAITITSAAAGTGGNTIVNIWGYRL